MKSGSGLMFYVKNSCVVCFLCGCLCVSAFKEQTNMVFIQLGQIKVNVAHSGAKQKSKNGTYGTIGTYQQNKKK